MSVYAGPNTVESGLILALDAGNNKSYPGTGTTWTDLSSNLNNGTLINGPTFSSSNGGSIVFDGVDDTTIVTDSNSLDLSSAITIETWIYPTKSTGVQNVISKSNSTNNNGYIFPRTDNAWAAVIFYLHIGGWTTLSATWPGLNIWTHTAATYDGSNMIVYINGLQANSKAQSGTIATNVNNLTLGDQPSYNEFYGGRLAKGLIYNRALTAAEILQNFNATRGRFGV
jgi:hypothetical protein